MAGRKLFNRVIMQSGSANTMQAPLPLDSKYTGGTLSNLIQLMGVTIEELRTCPAERIIEYHPKVLSSVGLSIGYVTNDSMLQHGFFHDKAVFHPDVIIGDCLNEGVIFYPTIKTATKDQVKAELKKVKDFDLDDLSNDDDFTRLTSGFLNASLFIGGTEAFIQSIPDSVKISQYQFARGNSFKSDFHGISHHVLDMQYFGAFDEFFTDPLDVEISTKIMTFWIDFINGKQPWEPLRNHGGDMLAQGNVMVFGRDGQATQLCDKGRLADRNWEYIEWVVSHLELAGEIDRALISPFI